MKKHAFAMFLFIFAMVGTSLSAASINWTTDYNAALQKAKETNKPVVLFFTGSDWCAWCKKLEAEALHTEAFANAAGDKFIFVLLDYPMKTALDPKLAEQNAEIQRKYDVRSFPTLIILDSQGKQIGLTGYRAGGGASYAEHLQKIVQEYSAYKQQMNKLGSASLSSTELKQLYRKAKEFGLKADAEQIVKAGMESDRSDFFKIERYRHLGKVDQLDSGEAVSLKETILVNDPQNSHFSHYQIACIDFDHCLSQMNQKVLTVEEAVKPLEDYIIRFGANDTDNVWRMEMMVAQVYLNSAKPDIAMMHAQKAYNQAPADRKEDLSLLIEAIRTAS